MAVDCNLKEISELTKNYTGAELEALVKSASSHCISRCTNIMDFSKEFKYDEKNLGINMKDFLKALEEVKPSFGVDEENVNKYFREKTVNYGSQYETIMNRIFETSLMKDNLPSQSRTILLYGKSGVGKSTFALNYLKQSQYSYMKIIAP